MYLHQVSEFADYLSGKEHSVQDVLNHLVRVVLDPLDVSSALYYQANNSKLSSE